MFIDMLIIIEIKYIEMDNNFLHSNRKILYQTIMDLMNIFQQLNRLCESTEPIIVIMLIQFSTENINSILITLYHFYEFT